MPLAIVLVIALAIVALVVFAIVVQRRRERERTEALKRVAETARLAFQPVGELGAFLALGQLPLCRRGRSKRVKNVMTGQVGEGEEVALFDYEFTTGAGKDQHVVRQTVVVFPGGGRSLPDLTLAPENVFHRIGEAFGYQDIDFDSSPEFSRRYLLRGPDENAIRSALYPEALSYLAEHEGWTVEVASGTVAIYRAGRRQRPDDVPTFLEDARALLRQIVR